MQRHFVIRNARMPVARITLKCGLVIDLSIGGASGPQVSCPCEPVFCEGGAYSRFWASLLAPCFVLTSSFFVFCSCCRLPHTSPIRWVHLDGGVGRYILLSSAPSVCFQIAPTGFHESLASTGTGPPQVSSWPSLRPLVLTVKAYLKSQGLNDVSAGGLSSYGMTYMVWGSLLMKQACIRHIASPLCLIGWSWQQRDVNM